MKTRRAPTYHYKSTHAPFLSETGGVARLPDQTVVSRTRWSANRSLAPSGVSSDPVGPRATKITKNDAALARRLVQLVRLVQLYGAQQNVFLRDARRSSARRRRRGDVRLAISAFPKTTKTPEARDSGETNTLRARRRISSRPAVRREKGLRRGRADAPRASERRAERGAGAGARRAARWARPQTSQMTRRLVALETRPVLC